MLDESIDEDSLTDDMYQILFNYKSPAYINIALTLIDTTLNIMLSELRVRLALLNWFKPSSKIFY